MSKVNVNNLVYFNQYFWDEHIQVTDTFGGHGRKHSTGKDEQFLHKSWQYHTWKAFTHLVRGCFGTGIDKDSGHHHHTLAMSRLYMAMNRRESNHALL